MLDAQSFTMVIIIMTLTSFVYQPVVGRVAKSMKSFDKIHVEDNERDQKENTSMCVSRRKLSPEKNRPRQ